MKVSRLIYEAIRFQVELDYCDRHGLTHYYFNKDEADRLSVLEEVVAYYNDIYDHVVEIWCQLHRPMELLENINRYVSVLTAEKDIFDIEPAYNVILKAFSENPELSDPYDIAPRILEFLQHEPVLINIPYNVLGIQHTAWHKDELVSMVGVGPGYTLEEQLQFEWPDLDDDYEEDQEDPEWVEDEEKWITMHPHGKDKKGQAVLIEEEEGKPDIIKGGLGGKYNNQPVSAVDKSKKSKNKALHSQREVESSVPPTKRSTTKSQQLQGTAQAIEEAWLAQLPPERRVAHLRYMENNQKLMRLDSEFGSNTIATYSTVSYTLTPNQQQEPLSHAFLVREQQENSVLKATFAKWNIPLINYDFEYLYSDSIAFTADRDYINEIKEGVYKYRALKRLAINIEHPLTQRAHNIGIYFETVYQQKMLGISNTHAEQIAQDLGHCAEQIGETALVKAKHAAIKAVHNALTKNFRDKDIPPSLLSLIGTATNPRNPYYKEYNDQSIYVKIPSSIAEFEESRGSSNNPAFNNLFNALTLTVAVEFTPKATAELKAEVLRLYNKAYVLYRESQDGLPISVALNRDMAVIAIMQQQSRYGNALYYPEYMDGVKKRKPSMTTIQWLKLNSRFYEYTIPNDTLQPFARNCQAGVVAFELFIRGYAVEARPNMKNDHNLLSDLSLHPNLIWRDPITKTAPDIRPIATFEQLEKFCYFGERYNLIIHGYSIDPTKPDQRYGHIVTVMRYQKQHVIIIDPQSGFYGPIQSFKRMLLNKYQVKTTGLFIYRIDNCEIFVNYANRIVREPRPGNTPVLDAKRS